MKRLLACITATAALGCSSDPPVAPSPTPGANAGTWTGTAADAVNGSHTLRLELTELSIDANRSLLGGSWRVESPAPERSASGTIAGTRSGAVVQLSLQPSVPLPCAPGPFAGAAGGYAATSLTVSAATIAGPYAYQTCDGSVPGALTVRRQ